MCQNLLSVAVTVSDQCLICTCGTSYGYSRAKNPCDRFSTLSSALLTTFKYRAAGSDHTQCQWQRHHHRHVMHASASVSNLCLVVEQSAQLPANTASPTLHSRAACQPQYWVCFCACRWDPQDRCACLAVTNVLLLNCMAVTNVLLLNCICFPNAEFFLRLQVLLCSFVVSGSMPWSGSS